MGIDSDGFLWARVEGEDAEYFNRWRDQGEDYFKSDEPMWGYSDFALMSNTHNYVIQQF